MTFIRAVPAGARFSVPALVETRVRGLDVVAMHAGGLGAPRVRVRFLLGRELRT